MDERVDTLHVHDLTLPASLSLKGEGGAREPRADLTLPASLSLKGEGGARELRADLTLPASLSLK